MDPLLIAFIVGLLQGICEWLPVSSTAITMIVLLLIGLKPSIAYTYALTLNLSSVIAVAIYFRGLYLKTFYEIINFDLDYLSKFLITSTFITALVGIPIYLILRFFIFTNISNFLALLFLGLFLIITGIMIRIKRTYPRGRSEKPKFIDALVIGTLQGVSVIPGLSRSGLTIAGFIMRGFSLHNSLKYSYYISLPALLGVAFLGGLTGYNAMSYNMLVAFLISMITSIIFIKMILELSSKISPYKFVVIFGIFVMILSFLFIMLEK